MPRFRRTDRINEQLKQEIAILVRGEVRDPRVGLATITAVETSPELDHAKVFITTLGDDEEKEAALSGLRSAAPFIRGQLGRRLHMRRIPELHFHIDRVLEEATRIELLLREALPDSRTGDDVLEEDTPSE
jgi:ribosome-binding factor A